MSDSCWWEVWPQDFPGLAEQTRLARQAHLPRDLELGTLSHPGKGKNLSPLSPGTALLWGGRRWAMSVSLPRCHGHGYTLELRKRICHVGFLFLLHSLSCSFKKNPCLLIKFPIYFYNKEPPHIIMTSTKNRPTSDLFIYLHWWSLPSLPKIIFSSYL